MVCRKSLHERPRSRAARLRRTPGEVAHRCTEKAALASCCKVPLALCQVGFEARAIARTVRMAGAAGGRREVAKDGLLQPFRLRRE